MAAVQEVRRLFADFLLGAEVSDSFTLNDFRQLFPSKYRDHSDVGILYQAFQMKRKKIRETVKRNIRRHCSNIPLDSTQEIASREAEDSLSELEEEEENLRQEISSVEEQMTAVREQLNGCLETLEHTEWFSGLHQKDFDLKHIQELSEKLGININ